MPESSEAFLCKVRASNTGLTWMIRDRTTRGSEPEIIEGKSVEY